MVVLLTVFSAGEVSSYRASAATEDRVAVIRALQSLVQELQDERGATVALLAGNTEFRAEIGPARQRVDGKRESVRALLTGGGEIEAQAAASVDKLAGLVKVRADADTGQSDKDDTFDFYTGLIEELSDNTRHLEIVSDDRLRRGAESVEQLVEIREATAAERVFLHAVFSAGGFRDGEYAEFLGIIAARDLYLTELDEFATPDTKAAMRTLLSTESAARVRALEQLAVGSGDGKKLLTSPQTWWSAVGTVLDDLSRLAEKVGTNTQAEARDLRKQATLRITLLGVVVLLCLAGSIFLATIGIRSLALPLMRLADEANRLALDRLPEAVRKAVAGDTTPPPGAVPVAPGATSEVRRVADAFERVQETAYDLATEQARLRHTSSESLANLSRRNQNLLRRQLGFITRLEREESDPAGLANLFELDHLATRMRRNAESLLVLVGAASPRQWSGQLPVTDVIRAAVSEVEEYRRVVLRRIEDVNVQGWIASGLAHMLAELIENGLTFSPPDVEVEIHGREIPGGYLIAVCDQGIGMDEEEIQRANERLRGDGDFLIAPARFLGHYVVGRLAAELSVKVQLIPSAVTGVTARIYLPAAITTGSPAVGSTPDAPAKEPDEVGVTTVRIPAARVRPRALEVDYVVVGTQPTIPAPRAAAITTPLDERTPNGLRKRVPRDQRPAVPAKPAAVKTEAPASESSSNPGSRLSALRDGIRRGHTHRVGRP
ncbi:hypothetical protein Ate02nite_17050 [Paractinoplanes tereljensis]|uniref:histidine kinase n=2 Tax=Paractinoplanes tereljensis TaxID=571912 RepID=A0A919NIY5_9ACTN|nr:hypothetical protein Ate02nite_17050 [Actinoplanes tereljensis]